jgi:hypothetical protein
MAGSFVVTSFALRVGRNHRTDLGLRRAIRACPVLFLVVAVIGAHVHAAHGRQGWY